MRILFLLTFALLLGGCATRGALNIACSSFETEFRKDLHPSTLERAIHGDTSAGLTDEGEDELGSLIQKVLIDEGGAIGLPGESEAKPRAILLLSGGGQWGAFGASYLAKLHATNSLPDFRVITGVSTGALQSLFVAIGDDDAYDHLIRSYSPESEKAIVTRNAKALTAVTGSFAGIKPLKARIENALCPDISSPCMIDRLAELEGHRAVLIGFVSATSGKFQYIDAVQVASQDDRENARNCLVGAALASAAMPVKFQQVRINDRSYYDGGVRQSVFEVKVAELVQAKAEGLPIYVVRNGPTHLLPTELDDAGLSNADRNADAFTAAERAEAILVNETEVRSIAVLRLDNPSVTLRLVTANEFDKIGKCSKAKDAMFDPAFMACLRDYGEVVANRDNQGWRELPPIIVEPTQPPDDGPLDP